MSDVQIQSSKESRPTGAAAPRTITVRSPANGEVLGEIPVMTEQDVRDAIRRARTAQKAWALLPIEERCRRVAKVGDLFVEKCDALVDLLVREAGKPRHEALAHEVLPTVNACHYYTRNAPQFLANKTIDLQLLKHRRSYVKHVPMGVIGVISPWNFPLVLPMSPVLEAIIAGNGVVVKPSEVTPLIMLEAKRLIDEAGVPPDLVQVVTGDGATGAALVRGGVQKIHFTGAVNTGRRVGMECAQVFIPCVLELGGKAPAIVLEDADVERTAHSIVDGGFANSGQVCISIERVLVHESVHDALVDRVVQLTKELRQGDPTTKEVDVGAIIFPKQIDIAEAHIRDAVAKGAIVATGGRRGPEPGMYFEPTVLTNCRLDMTVMNEEIFGPVVPIMKVRDEEEAIRIANDSELGLNAYVFSGDRERGCEVAERIEAGSIVVNDVLINYGAPETPFGGIKQSGWGRTHGEDSIRAMCYARHINYDRMSLPFREPWTYPYTRSKYSQLKTVLKGLFSRHGFMGKIADLF